MRQTLFIIVVATLVSCGPKPGADEPQPEPTGPPEPTEPERPHMAVPALSSYGWLPTAGIVMARSDEKASVEARLQDFYSGLPTFMSVLAMALKDRSVGLRDNPAYLTDIWTEYLSMMGHSAEDPPTALDDFDLGMTKYAIYRAWKKENPHTGVDNYDDAITTVSYGE
jgi:hypothetical protein